MSRKIPVLLLAALATAWPNSGCGLLLPLITNLTQPGAPSADDATAGASSSGSRQRPGNAAARQAGTGTGSNLPGEVASSPSDNLSPGLAGGTDTSNGSGDSTGAVASPGGGGTFAGPGRPAGSGNDPGDPGPGSGSGSLDRGNGIIVVPAAKPLKAGNALDDYIEDVRKSISATGSKS